jgi:hypothetical protein
MAIATTVCCISQIGETAGAIWKSLAEQGPLSMSRIIKEVDAPRDVVMQAIGWLAREDKIEIEDSKAHTISLR